ncbi:MAG: DUF502 domain-containing protein [bacterium]
MTPGNSPKPEDLLDPIQESAPSKSSKEKLFSFAWVRNKFITGLFVAFPLIITLWVLQLIYQLVNSFCDPIVRATIVQNPNFFPSWMIMNGTIPGAGFAMTFLLLLGLGILMSNYLGKKLVRILDNFLLRLPVFNAIYKLAKQIVEAFQEMTRPDGLTGKQVVYVRYPGSKGYLLGFLTGRFTNAESKKMAVVFIPNSPNPITGFVLVFEESEVLVSDLQMRQAWKMIVSGGLVSPSSVTLPVRPVTTT